MRTKLNESTLKAYRNKWDAVAKVERQELRRTTTAMRWRQLNALMSMARGLGIQQREFDAQSEVIRARWQFLRERYMANQQRRAD